MQNSEHFWSALDQLVAENRVVIDRPKGSAHPRYPDLIYPHDYGYLEGTQAADKGGIDVWRGSLGGMAVTGVIATVDLNKKDAEIKILIACTPTEAQAILELHNGGSQAAALIWR